MRHYYRIEWLDFWAYLEDNRKNFLAFSIAMAIGIQVKGWAGNEYLDCTITQHKVNET